MYHSSGTCTSHLFNILIVACEKGYTGQNCDVACRFPLYGQDCKSICNCTETTCDPVNGCIGHSTGVVIH